MKHEGNRHNAHAEAFLRRAGYGADNRQPAEGKTSEARQGPVDIALDLAKSPSARGCNSHVDADTDYFKNLRDFERRDDMAAEPTRSKANDLPGGSKRRK